MTSSTETQKVVPTEAQAALIEKVKILPSKSAQIRYLAKEGIKTGEIAKVLTLIYYPGGEKEVRYQHVRNVLMMKVKGE